MRLFRGASFLLGGLLLCLTLSAQEPSGFDAVIRDNAKHMADEGKQTFRFDTFGDESFWGDTLRLHEAIEGQKLGGVGPGVSPATALAVGLKVDVDALPASVIAALREGKVRGGIDRAFQQPGSAQFDWNSVCPLSFHRGRFVRSWHRSSAGWLGES